MRKAIFKAVTIAAIATATATPAAAQPERRGPSLTLKAGTNGLGAEVTYGLSHIVRVRGGVYGFKAGFDTSTSDIDYDMNLRLLSGGGYVDVHPFKGRFRLTAGVIYNANRVNATGLVNSELTFGNTTFTPAQVGTLDGRVDFNTFSPYAGIGWGSPFTNDSNWAFEADIGVMFQGAPDVTLRSLDGELTGNQILINALADEEAELEDELKIFKFYPVISLGVGYTF